MCLFCDAFQRSLAVKLVTTVKTTCLEMGNSESPSHPNNAWTQRPSLALPPPPSSPIAAALGRLLPGTGPHPSWAGLGNFSRRDRVILCVIRVSVLSGAGEGNCEDRKLGQTPSQPPLMARCLLLPLNTFLYSQKTKLLT